MDVRCNRCSTDYEFDDALISDRGTTVQCTNCGYQFKIYPERTAVFSPERWVVHTMSGRELVYTSLRDLQRAIGDHQVGPKDLLSRGNQPSRPLGAIPELEPFFVSTTSGSGRGMQSVPRTLHGVAPPPTATSRPPPEPRSKSTQRGFALPEGAVRQAAAAGREAGVTREPPGMSSTLRAGEFEQHAAPQRVLGIDTAAAERQPPAPTRDIPIAQPAARRGPSVSSTQRSGTPPGFAKAPETGKTQPFAKGPLLDKTQPLAKGPRLDETQPLAVGAGAGKTPPLAATLRSDSSLAPSFDSTLPAATPPPNRGPGRSIPPVQVRTSVPPESVTKAPARHVDTQPGPLAKLDKTQPVPSLTLESELLPSVEDTPLPSPRSPFASSPFTASALASSPRAAPTPGPPPVSTREHLQSYDEVPLDEAHEHARHARSRWIAGVVFVGVVALLAATLGQKYLVRLSTGRKAEPAQRDDRAVRLLQEGVRLLDQADYEAAEGELVKAQALSERDPGVLAGLARLETARADLLWLKLRLLDPTSKEQVQATTRELGLDAAKARQASAAAFAVAADDPVVIRARVDAMRIAGDEAKAREWIAPIAANASDPQNAYVLAALDLSEASPAFGTVIDRLRAAAVSQHEATRARGALIYALVRAGRVVEAETELAKVVALAHPHPLAAELKGFVERFSAPLDGGVVAVPTASASSVAPAATRLSGSGEALPGGDFRARLTQAAQAVAGGNFDRAGSFYQSVLNEQPSNTEALAGLAEVARRRGDAATAGRLYARVLEVNPSYLPALMATADQKWSSGDREGAVALYRRILEQAGPATDYGQRAQSRIGQAESASHETPAANAPADAPTATSNATSAPPADTTAPPRSRPDIDTSDLPGVTPP